MSRYRAPAAPPSADAPSGNATKSRHSRKKSHRRNAHDDHDRRHDRMNDGSGNDDNNNNNDDSDSDEDLVPFPAFPSFPSSSESPPQTINSGAQNGAPAGLIPSINVAADPKDGEKNGGNGGGDVVDAGLRSLDHYKRALPRWRYRLRQRLLPLIRWETPYLAYFQSKVRSPALDSYFAITANLGTHTFFMVGLPMLFWFDYTQFGKGIVHVLASGVFFSGFVKDLCSLPRPLSPPLQRITMSDSVALEYGFPSTHSTNAVSVAVYAVLQLGVSDFAPGTTRLLELVGYFYALSIVVGRLYCGMHGFFDVIIGSLMGAAIGWIEFYWVPALDIYMLQSSWLAPLAAVLLIIVLVRIHPEPADDCPCFDDSVAFAGVLMGLEIGTWHLPRLRRVLALAPGGAIAAPSVPVALLRVVFGVLVVFAWREVMKPLLLKTLPHLFRIIETHGLNLPRRFFVQASEYGKIPEVLRLRTDNVIPSISDIPVMMQNIRNARRGRAISVGPQSAADAYETLAYRERRRRESIGSQGSVAEPGAGSTSNTIKANNHNHHYYGNTANDRDGKGYTTSGAQQHQHSLAEFEEMMGQGAVGPGPSASVPRLSVSNNGVGGVGGGTAANINGVDEQDPFSGRQGELGEKEMFEKLVKPRVRYDVEVVTKLIVYAGIGWLAVEIIPAAFELVGLGS
ncbi:sphingosine-1-phosphate phosphohydrolase [Niveomyces insectorum RCEF 264]|uniref:Sphingosine-1-phosphate phosphohydrolase n=1 Tax=Niveomyces insectorum RCEF 264 TaxID=1081102 RepID=A0A167Q9Y7_9HYPO|nr:sphingosine-1-phosphate phosphohydrolase [Niveomyces insectorum RCEF 264]